MAWFVIYVWVALLAGVAFHKGAEIRCGMAPAWYESLAVGVSWPSTAAIAGAEAFAGVPHVMWTCPKP